MINITTGTWATLKESAQHIRYQVFVIEQNIPIDLEWDEMDAVSVHAVAYDQMNRAMGTGRLLPDGHIGRMAVLASDRNKGVGGVLLTSLMEVAKARGDAVVMLNAQVQVAAFYNRYGFVPDGGVYMEAGIPHLPMRCIFD